MQNPLEITFHPADLSRHGKTPAGANLYRIVWSDTRIIKYSLGDKVFSEPMYDYISAKWVLEKWEPASKIVGMTRSEWEDMFRGPMWGKVQTEYPEGGDYEVAYVFDGQVDEVTLHQMIAAHIWKMNNKTTAERTLDIEAREEQKLQVAEGHADAIIEEAYGEYK